jgi:hypothetical protein
MEKKDSSDAPFLPIPNGMVPPNYPQKFVYSNDFPKKPPAPEKMK